MSFPQSVQSANQNLIPMCYVKESILNVVSPSPDIDENRCAVITAKSLAAICSAFAKVFYVPISLKLPVGPLFAVGNTTGFFCLEFWAASRTIDEISKSPKTRDEQKNSVGKCRAIGHLVLAEAIALSAQIPTAFAAYNYNEKKFKVLAGLVTGISGSLFPLRSVQLSLKKLLQYQKNTEQDPKLTEIKSALQTILKINQQSFLKKASSEKEDFVKNSREIRAISSENLKVERYLQLMCAIHIEPTQLHSSARKYAEICVMCVGGALTITLQTALGMYSYSQTKRDVYDNDYLAGVFASLAVLSNIYLMGTSIIATSTQLFNSIVDAYTGEVTFSFAKSECPRATFSLKTLGFLIDGLGLGPTIVIWGEFYDKNIIEQRYFQVALCMSIFLLLFTASLQISEDLVTAYIRHCGATSEKERLEVTEEFDKLGQLVDQLPQPDLSILLSLLPEDLKSHLEQKLQVTVDAQTDTTNDRQNYLTQD